MYYVYDRIFYNKEDVNYDGMNLESFLNRMEEMGLELISCINTHRYINASCYELIFKHKGE